MDIWHNKWLRRLIWAALSSLVLGICMKWWQETCIELEMSWASKMTMKVGSTFFVVDYVYSESFSFSYLFDIVMCLDLEWHINDFLFSSPFFSLLFSLFVLFVPDMLLNYYNEDCCVHCILACLFCEFLTLCNIVLGQASCGICTSEACCCCCGDEMGDDCNCPCDMDCGIMDVCCESSDCLEICMECCGICFPSWNIYPFLFYSL